MVGFASQSLSSHHDALALLHKAFPVCWISFASQSLSVVFHWLCFAKPFHFAGLALLRKAFPIHHDRKIGFASQSLSILMDCLCSAKQFNFMERLCFAKHFLRNGLALLRKAFHCGQVQDELIRVPFYFFSLDFCSIFACHFCHVIPIYFQEHLFPGLFWHKLFELTHCRGYRGFVNRGVQFAMGCEPTQFTDSIIQTF